MANKGYKQVDIGQGMSLMFFEDAAQPVFVEKKGKPYVYYGQKNDYPQYLLYLYNNSAKHMALVNGKVTFIMGKGWTFSETLPEGSPLKTYLDQVNAEGESLQDVSEKCALDIELFNGAYVQVEWGKNGLVADIYHVDYSYVRSNKDNSKFFVSEEWVTYKEDGTYTTNSRPKYEDFDAYNPNSPSGTQILYIKKYHPGINTYTLPNYRGSINWIEVDIEIGNYHLTNVKSGFFANKLINMFNGVPGEEEGDQIETDFKSKFTGVKGQRFMICFNEASQPGAKVEDLNISESDKLFDLLNKTTQQEILTGHNVTSPMLFGIKTEGQLGGNNELRTAFEIFQNTYINGKQQWLERVFNAVLKKKGLPADNPVLIQRSEPVAFQFGETIQAQAMSQDEIRERMGMAPIEKKESDKSKDVINAINSLSPLVANKVLENLTRDELRALVNLQPAPADAFPEPTVPTVPSTSQFSAEDDARDAAVFGEFGTAAGEYKVIKSTKAVFLNDEQEKEHFAGAINSLSDIQKQILAILKKDPLTTQQALADSLEESLDMINSAIQDLVTNELLKVKTETKNGETVVRRSPLKDADKLLQKVAPEKRSIQVMYSYEGPKDHRNRPFCAELLRLNRLYSRADIEKISTRLDYSVWARRGGWYTVPGTNEHRPYCRHTWKSNVVVKRES